MRVDRRDLLKGGAALLLGDGAAGASKGPSPARGAAPARAGQAARLDAELRQATGVKVGEVSSTSAIVWMRLTRAPVRKRDGVIRRGTPAEVLPATLEVDDLEGACPGAPGLARVRWSAREDLADAADTPWIAATAATDFTVQFHLTELEPGTAYHFAAETAPFEGESRHGSLRGRFSTAPAPDIHEDVRFGVITCQAYRAVGHPDGFHIYQAMRDLDPRFVVKTGDSVYYDSDDPRATTIAVARYHWHRMYSYPRHIAFHLRTPCYWEKDDHDTFKNDCWPGQPDTRMAPLTFADGLRIFREQVPMGARTYRNVRWGKGLEIWLVEGRDFRSPNRAPDGPQKTIWGEEQKAWLKRTLLESDADFRVLISPTPLVGPDKPGKSDNHANDGFASEGREFRGWIRANRLDNLFVVCGDRHWQYHSVHPETGLHEFGCGPASDEHAGQGGTVSDPRYQRFYRVIGGFLSVATRRVQGTSEIAFRLHDVQGRVVYEHLARRPTAEAMPA